MMPTWPKPSDNSIVCCLLAKDEASRLASCLERIAGFVDQIIVVDNGSRDNTVAVARHFGAIVLSEPALTFEDARNAYLRAATQEWVLVIDADEHLCEFAARSLRQIVAGANPDVLAIRIPRYEYYGAGKWSCNHLYRLFRNRPEVKYTPRVLHSSVIPSIDKLGGVLAEAYVPVHHLDILIGKRSHTKRQRYIQLLQQEVARDPSMHVFLALEYMALRRDDNAERELRQALACDLNEYWTNLAKTFLAELYLLQGRLNQAEAAADALLEADKEFKELEHINVIRAEIALRRGKKADSLALCERSLEAFANSPHMHMNLAALLQEVDAELALKHLGEAVRLNSYLLKPVIYRAGERPNLFEVQVSLLSCVENLYVHMVACNEVLGRREDACAWREAGNEVARIRKSEDVSRMYDNFGPY